MHPENWKKSLAVDLDLVRERTRVPPSDESMGVAGSGEEVSFEVLVFTLVDCRLLSDGLYPLAACESKYVSCRAGLPSIRHCFPGQFYSAVHQICEEPHKIGCTDDGDFSGSFKFYQNSRNSTCKLISWEKK